MCYYLFKFVLCFFFFFKQKTAYEMRISDWSSDVCSSDLSWRGPRSAGGAAASIGPTSCGATHPTTSPRSAAAKARATSSAPPSTVRVCSRRSARSEEHTSELQSLMRRSYGVFCLEKKKYSTSRAHSFIRRRDLAIL